jgi:hypothetical protein
VAPLVAACVAIAALSLLGPAQPTYDPWAWIIWGREILGGDLDTNQGPSWKPLPVLFTTPFAIAGELAPELWLVVARAGGLLAIVMAFRLGTRLAGPAAGAIAALALALADEFIRHFARGNSEGMLVALCLWAVERHLDGRRGHAFVLGVAAGLLRPEVWPFLAAYGVFLMLREPGLRLWVVAAGAATLALWFVPEYLGSGDWLRAASRARDPNLDSPAHAPRPFLEVFRLSAGVLAVPALLGAAVALGWRRTRTRTVVALGAAAAVLMLGVAAMTEGGFAGNLRYVALPAAFVCVLAGVGWAGLIAAADHRWGRRRAWLAAAGCAAVALPLVWSHVDGLGAGLRGVRAEAEAVSQLPQAVELAGGADAVRRCGGIYTTRFQVPWVAWAVRVHLHEVEIFAFPPGTALAPHETALAEDPRFALVGETPKWIVRRACA